MAKRLSGPPRRPRNPVAKTVRAPRLGPRAMPNERRPWPARGKPMATQRKAAADDAAEED